MQTELIKMVGYLRKTSSHKCIPRALTWIQLTEFGKSWKWLSTDSLLSKLTEFEIAEIHMCKTDHTNDNIIKGSRVPPKNIS